MKFISSRLWGLINRINNVSIKKKLISMYILCVLIPILFINTLFYIYISNNVKAQELAILNQSMERILISFTTDIEQCMGVSRTINLDGRLNSVLDNKYESSQDYYEAYHNYLEEAIGKYIPVYNQIQDISVYTENNTIVDSKYYHYISNEVLNSPWYKSFAESKKSPLVTKYIAEDSRSIYGDNRRLSIISKLFNYKDANPMVKIIKIDIWFSSLLNIVNNEKIDGVIYLIDNEGEIVFSNREDIYNNTNEFKTLQAGSYTSKDIVISNNFGPDSYLSGWKLVGVFQEKDIVKFVRDSKNTVILVALSSLIIATLVILIISGSIKNRLEIVSKHLKDVSNQKFNIIKIEPGGDEIGTLIQEFNNSTIEIKRLIEEVYQSEIEKAKAEIRSLQNQVNPHFMYNTLNTIRLRSVLKGETETAEIMKYMAKSFRRLLAWKNDLVTIREEMQFINEFLQIQKYRYDDKLNYNICVDEDTLDYKIPKMCVQALVENCSVHGIEMAENSGTINIKINKDNQYLYCSVADDGIGIEKGKLELIRESLQRGSYMDNSYGISNIYLRLKLYFGEAISFTINSELNKGTTVDIIIPIERMSYHD